MHEGLCSLLFNDCEFVGQGLKLAKVTMLLNCKIIQLEGTFDSTSGHLRWTR